MIVIERDSLYDGYQVDDPNEMLLINGPFKTHAKNVSLKVHTLIVHGTFTSYEPITIQAKHILIWGNLITQEDAIVHLETTEPVGTRAEFIAAFNKLNPRYAIAPRA